MLYPVTKAHSYVAANLHFPCICVCRYVSGTALVSFLGCCLSCLLDRMSHSLGAFQVGSVDWSISSGNLPCLLLSAGITSMCHQA